MDSSSPLNLQGQVGFPTSLTTPLSQSAFPSIGSTAPIPLSISSAEKSDDDSSPDETQEALAPSPTSPSTGIQCVVCREEKNEPLYEMPCKKHWSCAGCIANRVEKTSSMTDFPPFCCLVDSHRPYIDPSDPMYAPIFQHRPDIIIKYNRRWVEYETEVQDRRYCANLSCKAKQPHLPMSSYEEADGFKWAFCDGCNYKTCVTCNQCLGLTGKDLEHLCNGPDAKGGSSEVEMPPGVKRCPFCTTWVLHPGGGVCNMSECPACRVYFCWICLEKWEKQHDCPPWNMEETDPWERPETDPSDCGQTRRHLLKMVVSQWRTAGREKLKGARTTVKVWWMAIAASFRRV